MGTRALVLTLEERRFVAELVARAWAEADTARLLARIDSPQEAAALADQQFIEGLQAKLRALADSDYGRAAREPATP